MLGAKIDQLVMTSIIEQRFPKIMKHLNDMQFDPSIVMLRWFTCIFAYSFDADVMLRLWDAFFLKGEKILFRVTCGIFDLLQTKIL